MRTNLAQRILFAFVAGFISVLIFHQGFLLLSYLAGWVPNPPYSLAATPPLGVPKVLSLAFWGGVWGIVMMLALRRLQGWTLLWSSFLFGGVLATLVAFFVVTPLKGLDVSANLRASHLLFGFLINGFWGLGTALIYGALASRRVLLARS